MLDIHLTRQCPRHRWQADKIHSFRRRAGAQVKAGNDTATQQALQPCSQLNMWLNKSQTKSQTMLLKQEANTYTTVEKEQVT